MKRLLLCAVLLATVSCAETLNAAAASVNGEEISQTELELQVDAQLAGNPGATDPATKQQIARDVLSSLIQQRLLGQAARAEGLDATDDEIDASIDDIRSRYPDEAAFLEAVTNAGLTLEELRERIAFQVLSTELGTALAPEPSDAEVQAAYDERRSTFREIQVKHILYAVTGENVAGARRRAENALGELRARTSTFAELARGSDDPSSAEFGGVLADQNGKRPGWWTDGELDPTFFEAAYEATPGTLIGPVRTGFGFHLIVTLKKRTTPLEQVREQLVAELKAQTGESAVQQAIGEAAIRARVLINPRFGDWDPATLTIVPHESYVPAEPEPSPSASLGLDPGFEFGG